MYLISDNVDTLTGMRLAGVDGVVVHEKEELRSAIETAMEDPDVLAAAKQVEEELGTDGRILLRQSGTEPLVRVMVEAETDALCAKYVKQVADVVKEKWAL